MEAANTLVWREFDAMRNSVSMLAQHNFSHKQLDRKTTKDKIAMLNAIGVAWDMQALPFRRGTILRRVQVQKTLTVEELNEIPEDYRPAFPVVARHETVIECPPILGTLANKVEFVFDDATPIVSDRFLETNRSAIETIENDGIKT